MTIIIDYQEQMELVTNAIKDIFSLQGSENSTDNISRHSNVPEIANNANQILEIINILYGTCVSGVYGFNSSRIKLVFNNEEDANKLAEVIQIILKDDVNIRTDENYFDESGLTFNLFIYNNFELCKFIS